MSRTPATPEGMTTALDASVEAKIPAERTVSLIGDWAAAGSRIRVTKMIHGAVRSAKNDDGALGFRQRRPSFASPTKRDPDVATKT